jgi:hypothetical protein
MDNWLAIPEHPLYLINPQGHIFSITRGRLVGHTKESQRSGFYSINLGIGAPIKHVRINRVAIVQEMFGVTLMDRAKART